MFEPMKNMIFFYKIMKFVVFCENPSLITKVAHQQKVNDRVIMVFKKVQFDILIFSCSKCTAFNIYLR